MRNLILSLILISNTAYAGVCDLPERVILGDKVPCTGYLFSDVNELKIRTDLTYKNSLIDNLTKQTTIQADMLKISNEQIQLYKESQPLSKWEKLLYFSLGVVATSLAVNAASKITK
jgi:hypothetical protein